MIILNESKSNKDIVSDIPFFDDSALADQFKVIEEKYQTYSQNKLCFGRLHNGKLFYLDISEALRIAFVGATRSGKTFAMHSIGDRLIQSGKSIVYLTDIKDEFKANRFPVQKKFTKLLLEDEKPTPTKVVTFRPTFFKEIRPQLPKHNYWISIDSTKLSRADFMTLINYDDLTPTQKPLMEEIYNHIKKNGLNSVMEFLKTLTGIKANVVRVLESKFKLLLNSGFDDPKYHRDLVTLIKKGYVPSFNFDDFDLFGKGNFLYPEVFVSIIFRQISEARKQKLIKPLFVMVDESPRFVPNNKNPSCKDIILESVDVSSRFNINFIFASQSLLTIPERILKNSRYFLIPKNADNKDFQYALKTAGLTTKVQRLVNDAADTMKRLKPYEWLVVDKKLGCSHIVKPLPPLSRHQETDI